MKHTCHAENCEREVNRRMLMCQFHWAMVPTEIQVKVKKYFHIDQCSGKRRPTFDWIAAAREAINYIKKLEKGGGT